MTRAAVASEAPAWMVPKRASVVIGIREDEERDKIMRAIARTSSHREIATAKAFDELSSSAARLEPRTIVFEEDILPSNLPFGDAARRLALFAPVVAVGLPERQSQLAALIARGDVDFVARAGECAAVVAALVERRLHARPAERMFRAAWMADLPGDFAEILRHEINNPLTGILGNAELLLSQHRAVLPPVSVQRLETVVDLAVRLRETIRCLGAEWERQHTTLRSVHSA
ncbi:MAG TPA: histidine kinase dimerization/phospho-acceptor domain-containing protein [Candidatus Acidoferrales bacterium]|nr:histidine kinase dimerization/phospho-acceptor domain-containing protein [Candidatus Acidoferrales bacterium]